MNYINYNQAMEALEKERQYLINHEQYEAENVLVHHAINVISEVPVVRLPEIVKCQDCKYGERLPNGYVSCLISNENENGFHQSHKSDFFCADGQRR